MTENEDFKGKTIPRFYRRLNNGISKLTSQPHKLGSVAMDLDMTERKKKTFQLFQYLISNT